MRSLQCGFAVMLMVFGVGCEAVTWFEQGEETVVWPGVSRIAVLAADAEAFASVRAAILQCQGVLHADVGSIRVLSAEIGSGCVPGIAALPGVVVEIDSTVMVQGGDVVAAASLPEFTSRGTRRIGADALWEEGGYGLNMRIAVVDTGVDCVHPEFHERIEYGVDVVDGAVVEQVEGELPTFCVDESGHGTAVAGLLVALHDGVGVKGQVPGARLYSVKALGDDGVGYFSSVAAGIALSVDRGHVDMILLPFGGFHDSVVIQAALQHARENGVVIVGAAGNTAGLDGEQVLFPAQSEYVIGVGAIDENDTLWSLSASGDGVDVVAPGAYEYTTLPGGAYAFVSGTSMAAARVAGGLLQVMNRLPMLTPEAIDDFILRTSDDLGAIGPDEYFGAGVLYVPSIVRMAEIGWKM